MTQYPLIKPGQIDLRSFVIPKIPGAVFNKKIFNDKIYGEMDVIGTGIILDIKYMSDPATKYCFIQSALYSYL